MKKFCQKKDPSSGVKPLIGLRLRQLSLEVTESVLLTIQNLPKYQNHTVTLHFCHFTLYQARNPSTKYDKQGSDVRKKVA